MGIQELANALGVSFQAIVKVRDGGSFGTANNVKAAKLFGLSSDWLATGQGEMQPSTERSPHPASGLIQVPSNTTANVKFSVGPGELADTMEMLTAELVALDESSRKALSALLAQYALDPVASAGLLPAIRVLLSPAKGTDVKKSAA